MQSDTIRLLASYVIAILVLAGAFVLIYENRGDSGQAWLAIGAVLGWAFNRESSAASARQTERAIAITPPQPPA